MAPFILSLAALAATVAAAPALLEPTDPKVNYGKEDEIFRHAQWTPVWNGYASGPYEQVIFLSFDGMHQFDLEHYIEKYPNSTWAFLSQNGVEFKRARGSKPSDSFPATSEIYTGALARDSGIWWENSYDRLLYPPSSNCKGPMGTVVDWSEVDDLDPSKLNGGGTFNMSALPMKLNSWGKCEVVLPHNYLRVNTVFEVARGMGLWTAFADKHLSYGMMNGPSGVGLGEGYFPEIASVGSTVEDQLAWDDLHWSALDNWINDKFVNGTKNPVGGPSLIGANFQAITFAQATYGYENSSYGMPTPELEKAFQASDAKLGAFLNQIEAAGKADSTLLLMGSKQGQGPVNPKSLLEYPQQKVIKAAGVPVSYMVGEDGGIIFLKDSADAQKAKANILKQAGPLGIKFVLAGPEVEKAGFGSPYFDSRVPDLVVGVKTGTLWQSTFEFEDHGGFLPEDLNVPLIAYSPSITPTQVSRRVSNRQIAATLLYALGLPLNHLQGYQIQGSPVLPFVFERNTSST